MIVAERKTEGALTIVTEAAAAVAVAVIVVAVAAVVAVVEGSR